MRARHARVHARRGPRHERPPRGRRVRARGAAAAAAAAAPPGPRPQLTKAVSLKEYLAAKQRDRNGDAAADGRARDDAPEPRTSAEVQRLLGRLRATLEKQRSAPDARRPQADDDDVLRAVLGLDPARLPRTSSTDSDDAEFFDAYASLPPDGV